MSSESMPCRVKSEKKKGLHANMRIKLRNYDEVSLALDIQTPPASAANDLG